LLDGFNVTVAFCKWKTDRFPSSLRN